VLNKLLDKYEKVFKEAIELNTFWNLDEKEQIKILKQCLELHKRIWENEYYNENYMEEVE
jgi:hypothetical protein